MKRRTNLDQPYTIITVQAGDSFGDQNWHQVVHVVNQTNSQLYVDGKPTHTANRNLESLGIASIVVHGQYFDSIEVRRLFSDWKSTQPIAVLRAKFDKEPSALAPDQVYMRAEELKLVGNKLQYFYSSTNEKGVVKKSGWLDNPEYFDFGLDAEEYYTYSLKIRDNYGNVSLAAQAVKTSTKTSNFKIFKDNFSIDRNYLKQSPGSAWSVLAGLADTMRAQNGRLFLSSRDTKWDGNARFGPFLYQNVSEDFIMETQIADLSGMKTKVANGANDVGLMIRASDGSLNLIQNSILPGWGVGNIVTDLNARGRFQYNNASGWNFYRHLQIQRIGNTFYLRGSDDGKIWHNLPGSPIVRKDWESQDLEVGLYQATYGIQSGYGCFKNFRLYSVK